MVKQYISFIPLFCRSSYEYIFFLGEQHQAVQEITEFPFEMNAEYFKAVKPQALFRHWFTPEYQRAYTFDYGVQLVFHNGGSEVAGKTIGSFKNYVESEAYAKEYLEFNHMINDLHSFDFDMIK